MQIDFRTLIDVRIIPPNDTNSGKDATDKVDEGPVGNDNTTLNLSDDKQKQTPNKGIV